MSKNIQLTREKPCFLENFQILQPFTACAVNFEKKLKNDSIFVFSLSMASFEPSQGNIKKNNNNIGDPKL